MFIAQFIEELVLEPLQGSICLTGDCERPSLVLRRVDLYQVLESVVIDVVCGTLVQSVSCVICFNCSDTGWNINLQ
jgi:hypothetical protein